MPKIARDRGLGVGAGLRDLDAAALAAAAGVDLRLDDDDVARRSRCCTFGIAAIASSTVIAGMPTGTGTPYFA